MVFWCRINQSRLKHLTHQFKRSYTQVPSLNYSHTHTKIYAADNPFWGIVRRPTDFCKNVRFFAAPFQAQKKEEEDSSGPRLNDQIKGQFVRLVTDEGHRVVSRHEALALARKLELDLVEVQRSAEPPVCKIMDYHKEKYKKEIREKDRSKAKSDKTLKKGDCKEVRFSGKIEQKDLKMKADTVQRLMERGYRVKCMALPVGKKEEAEDLGGYLSRLTALIEDISVVESGPHVERKQAYVILRHVKFGPPKKGGAKKLTAVGDASGVSKTATWKRTIDRSGDIPSPTFSEEDPEEFGLESEDETFSDEVDLPSSPPTGMRDKIIGKSNTTWSVLNSSDDFNELFTLPDDMKGKVMNAVPETACHPANLDVSNFARPKPVVGFSRADTLRPTPREPSPLAENRYQRSESRNQLPQKSIDNRGLGVRESFRLEPPKFPNQRRPPPPNMNISPSVGEQKQGGTDASAFRNSNLPNSMPRQEPSHHQVPNTPTPGYGVFSSAKANAPATKGSSSHSLRNSGTAGVGANQNIPGVKSDGSQRPGNDNGGQGKFGIFRK